jgi:hypothetical protein
VTERRRPDDAADSSREFFARLRETLENAPKGRPPTPEERAEAEARNAETWRRVFGIGGHFRQRRRTAIEGWTGERWKELIGIALPPEPEPPGPIPVVVIEDRAREERRAGTRPPARLGRPKGSEVPIPNDTFWTIFELAADEKASARRIDRVTNADPKLDFVNRVKAGRLVKWVADHPTAARAALRGKEIPKGFLATPDGVILPKP